MVVVAVIAEFAIAGIHPPYDSFLEQWGSASADAAVALGIVGEVLFSGKDARIQTELRIRSNAKVADAIEGAGKANERASIADLKAQEAILELAKFREPRILTGQQVRRIAEKLKQFSGTEYDAALQSNDPELMGLLWFLEIVLLQAGWKALDWPAPVAMVTTSRGLRVAVGISVTNLVVGMHPEQVSLLWPAAKNLIDELMAAGIGATIVLMPLDAGIITNATAIHILIGRKA